MTLYTGMQGVVHCGHHLVCRAPCLRREDHQPSRDFEMEGEWQTHGRKVQRRRRQEVVSIKVFVMLAPCEPQFITA